MPNIPVLMVWGLHQQHAGWSWFWVPQHDCSATEKNHGKVSPRRFQAWIVFNIWYLLQEINFIHGDQKVSVHLMITIQLSGAYMYNPSLFCQKMQSFWTGNKLYTRWSKILCAPDVCIVIIRCTETFWSPCIIRAFSMSEDAELLNRK